MELTTINERLRQRAVNSIPALELGLIVSCSSRDYGDNRKLELGALRATAAEHGASEKILCAAFGFLPALASPWGGYADVLNDPRATGFIDESDQPLQAAWALCRLSNDRHGLGRVCAKPDPMRDAAKDISRILACVRANHAARGPIDKSIRLTQRAAEIAQRLNITPKEKTA
jgi:hypothetical protein